MPAEAPRLKMVSMVSWSASSNTPLRLWTKSIASGGASSASSRRKAEKYCPPSTLVGVTVLGYPDQLVEVEAVAVRDSWQEPGPPHGDTVTA